jgi:hypothetical protein
MATFYEQDTYSCEIVSQAITESSTGNPMVVVEFRVLSYADGNPVTKQFNRNYRKAVTAKTVEYVVNDLRAMGFTGSSWSELEPSSPNYQSLAGQVLFMYCKHEEGFERWGVSRDNTPRESKPIEHVDAAKLRRLDAMFGKALAATATQAAPKRVNLSSAATATPAPRRAVEQPMIQDDDIPF